MVKDGNAGAGRNGMSGTDRKAAGSRKAETGRDGMSGTGRKAVPDGMMGSGKDSKRTWKKILFRMLPVLAPVAAVVLIWLISGTGPRRLDAWNTTWNDESGYYRIIRMMRTIGEPAGVYGFNESRSAHLSYGSYNPLTYLPYLILSFLTGTASHNFVYYCNVLLGMLGCLIYVCLCRPDRKQCLFTALFFVAQPILARYLWSGMSEGSYIFFMLVFTALGIAAEASGRRNRRILLIYGAALCALCFLWSAMRPYYLICFALPVALLWQAGGRQGKLVRPGLAARVLFAGAGLAAAALSMAVYVYFRRNYIPQYFAGAKASDALMGYLRGGNLPAAVGELISLNLRGLRSIAGSLQKLRWAGLLPVFFVVEWILLALLTVRRMRVGQGGNRSAAESDVNGRSRDGAESGVDGRSRGCAESDSDDCRGSGMKRKYGRQTAWPGALHATLLLAGAVTWEATVVLYNPAQLHRMLLALSAGYALLLMHEGVKERWFLEGATLVLLAVVAFGRPESLALPQVSARTVEKQEGQEDMAKLEKLLPRLEDPWDNTIAKPVEYSRMQYQYLLPDWIGLNVCDLKTLQERIETDTLQSRYVLLGRKAELNDLCKEKYEVIWKKYGKILYRKPD